MGSKGPEYTNPSIVYQRDRGGHYNLHNLPILTSATLGKSFMHHSDKDPIIAVATAAGRGGIGILRLSFGKALEAQFLVAIANSILTAIGLYFLGLGQSLAFLTAIVFLCSFIPVAGVFISSVPICILALQASGLHGVAMAIGLITFIHLIEQSLFRMQVSKIGLSQASSQGGQGNITSDTLTIEAYIR
jgi:hypothetical protein